MLRKTVFKCCQTCSSYVMGKLHYGLLLNTNGDREICRHVIDNWWGHMRQFKEQKCFTISEQLYPSPTEGDDAERILDRKGNVHRV
jgi:hypothetical protein